MAVLRRQRVVLGTFEANCPNPEHPARVRKLILEGHDDFGEFFEVTLTEHNLFKLVDFATEVFENTQRKESHNG